MCFITWASGKLWEYAWLVLDGSCNNGANERVLNVLKAIQPSFTKIVVHWVAVVKPRVYNVSTVRTVSKSRTGQMRLRSRLWKHERVTAETWLEKHENQRWNQDCEQKLKETLKHHCWEQAQGGVFYWAAVADLTIEIQSMSIVATVSEVKGIAKTFCTLLYIFTMLTAVCPSIRHVRMLYGNG